MGGATEAIGGGLNQLGRVRCRAGDVDGLQTEGLVDRLRQTRRVQVVRRLAQGVGEVLGIRRGDPIRQMSGLNT